jgi:RNA polymerase sigma-70 factor (ECF subfamily)
MLRLLASRRPVVQDRASPERCQASDPLYALAGRAAAGDHAAGTTLLVNVGPALLRVVRSVLGVNHPEVQDVCQEAALAVLVGLPRFRGECTTLHFACRVAVLTAMNARRRSRFAYRDTSAVDEHEELPDASSGPADLADAARRRAVLRRLLDELPMAQAEAVALHVVLGYTVDEAAAMLAVPVNTVRSRLRRALAALRQHINADHGLLEVVRGSHE